MFYVVLSFGVSKSKIADGCLLVCKLQFTSVGYLRNGQPAVVSFAGSLKFGQPFDPGTRIIPSGSSLSQFDVDY